MKICARRSSMPLTALEASYGLVCRVNGRAQRLESSEVVRQAYGYGLFTDHVELVMKRAAMLL